jgi:hypothetical protein
MYVHIPHSIQRPNPIYDLWKATGCALTTWSLQSALFLVCMCVWGGISKSLHVLCCITFGTISINVWT